MNEYTCLFPANELVQWRELIKENAPELLPAPVAPVAKKRAKSTLEKPIDYFKALNLIKPPKNLPIIQSVLVKDGRAYKTDMEQELSFPCPEQVSGLQNGLYSVINGTFFPSTDTGALTADDFPLLSTDPLSPGRDLPAETISAPVLFSALQQVASAQSTDQTRIILNGVYFERREAGGPLSVVATDSRRLHLKTLDGQTGEPCAFVIPSLAVKVLLQVLKNVSGDVRIIPQEVKTGTDGRTGEDIYTVKNVKFLLPQGGELVTKLIEGTYPNYPQVIPPYGAGTCKEIAINASEWLEALKGLETARKRIKQENKGGGTCENWLRLTVNESGSLTFWMSYRESDSLKQSVTVQAPVKWSLEHYEQPGTSERVDVFNFDFFKDILEALEGQNGAVLRLSDGLSPTLFMADDSAGGNSSGDFGGEFKAVLMSVRI